jgi:uncharacterized protein YkwD
MSFLDDAMRVGRSKTLVVAVVVGTTVSVAGVAAAQATPAAPVTDDCWSCGFEPTDTAFDDVGFTDEFFGDPPVPRSFQQPREFESGFHRPGWRPGWRLEWPGAAPSWPGRFRARPWADMYRARERWGRAYGTLSLESQVYALTNGERYREQCPGLRLDYALSRAARGHSREMAAYQYMSHTDYNNEDPSQRIEDYGYPARFGWAENVAYGSRTAGQVMYAWMTSPGHRKNILDCRMRAIGVGVARAQDGTLYWTQNFGGR